MTSNLELAELAINAEPTNEDDWGSESQIAAENAFYAALNDIGVNMAEYEYYCDHATLTERLQIGLDMASKIPE